MDVTLPDGTVIQGVPEGTTKAQLATKLKAGGMSIPNDWLKPTAPVAPKEDYGTFSNIVGSVTEPVAEMATGIIAKPVSDVAGLASLGMEGLRRAGVPFSERDPLTVKQDVQRALTYEPRTTAGQVVSEYNPFALAGRGINWLGEQAGRLVPGNGPVQNALAAGVQEAVTQAPMFIGLKAPAAAAATKTGLRGGAERIMESALKAPLKAGLTGKTASAVDTLLEEGINVTPGGAATLRERVNELNSNIKDRIANSPVLINQPQVMTRINTEMSKLIDKFQKQASYGTDVAAIQKAWEELINHPLLQSDFPVQTAQDIKQGTYRSLGENAYPGGKPAGTTAAEKTAARIMKEEVAAAVPEVRQLNAEESKLLNALSLVERRAIVSANKNPIGLGWLTTNPLHWGAYLADRSELFKSLVARMLNRTGKLTPDMTVAGPAAGMATSVAADQNTPP